MRKLSTILSAAALAAGFCGPWSAVLAADGGMSARFGVGTDVDAGLAIGVNINVLQELGPNPVELGVSVYGGHTEEDSNNGFNDYHEETDVFVVAFMANYLINYSPQTRSMYALVGVGAGVVSVEWMESSPTDTSLGTPLPGGGSMQEEDATAAGLMLDFGLGYQVSDRVDMRVELPILFITDAPGEATSVVPFLTLTAGYRF